VINRKKYKYVNYIFKKKNLMKIVNYRGKKEQCKGNRSETAWEYVLFYNLDFEIT
jgi:hypothetical protein